MAFKHIKGFRKDQKITTVVPNMTNYSGGFISHSKNITFATNKTINILFFCLKYGSSQNLYSIMYFQAQLQAYHIITYSHLNITNFSLKT